MSDLENKDSIPEVAKKQAEKADALHRQLYPDQYPDAKKEEPKPGEGTPRAKRDPQTGRDRQTRGKTQGGTEGRDSNLRNTPKKRSGRRNTRSSRGNTTRKSRSST